MEYHSGGSQPLLGRPRYCPGASVNGGYLCETGHCCGETGCCTYYYELWWFWLLWTVLILFSCCCAYRHRRAKLRVQQQQRQREISLLAYHGANSYPSSMLDLSFLASLKLPSYEEVAAQPSTPPPPYSSVFTTPRYPQPPRTADPHLLSQHGPLLHRPHSDGPSSLSSDNSCSCDSCCPSSPCSSSLSAPITYETDTSHASTPSEATPLTLDVTMETISAAATCLNSNEARVASERMVLDVADVSGAGAHTAVATNSSVPNQTVTVAVVTRAASPQPPPSPGFQLTLPVGTTSPIKQQLDIAPSTPILSEFDHIPPLPSNAQACFSSGSCSGSELRPDAGSGSEPLSTPTPLLNFSEQVSTTSSCPAITIESESSYATCQSPLATLSPSSPPSLSTSPPPPLTLQALSSTSLPAPALLLDPLTALHQSDKGGSSSGPASSLSPSPRATQSPPKQTLFSPCVDVFEPGPPSWENEDEEQEEKDNDEDEDEDMGADESQYRHRRLTGDSGIEVCRCRVEEEEEDDEEDDEEEEEGGRRGNGGERDKRSSDSDLHDSVDCPARGQVTTEEGLTLCTPTATTTPTSEDSGEVVIVMETPDCLPPLCHFPPSSHPALGMTTTLKGNGCNTTPNRPCKLGRGAPRGTLKLIRWSREDKKRKSSSLASDLPTQTRGPAPNGRKEEGVTC
ncbi:hypothetical protein ACER0C_001914 [Sarotherodon galilaeus]